VKNIRKNILTYGCGRKDTTMEDNMTNEQPMMYFFASAVCEITNNVGGNKATEFVSTMFCLKENPSEKVIKKILINKVSRASWKNVNGCSIISFSQHTKEQYDAY